MLTILYIFILCNFQSLEVLSVMAVIRLDGDNDGDEVQSTLKRALLDNDTTHDPLASNTWEEVTLILCPFFFP